MGVEVVGDTEGSKYASGRREKDSAHRILIMSIWLSLIAGMYTTVTRRPVLIQWCPFVVVGAAGLVLLLEEWHKLWVESVVGLFAAVVVGQRAIV